MSETFQPSQQLISLRHIYNPLQGDFLENTLEIDFLERGSLQVYYGQGICPMAMGDVLVVSGHRSIWLRPLSHSQERVLIFQVRLSLRLFPQELLSLSQGAQVRSFLQRTAQGLLYRQSHGYSLLKKLAQETEAADGWEQLLSAMKLLGQLAQMSGGESVSPFSVLLSGKTAKHRDTLVVRMEEYMETHYAEPFQLSQLIPVVGLTPASMCRFYKEQTGQTLLSRLGKIRMGHACRLLDDTDMPVKQIAVLVGYHDTAFFTRLFRRIVGMSPIEFRRRRL